MLVKLGSKNQLTLPEAILSAYPRTEYFDVTNKNGRIILMPIQLGSADAVRSKLAALGISEKDVADAVSQACSDSKKI